MSIVCWLGHRCDAGLHASPYVSLEPFAGEIGVSCQHCLDDGIKFGLDVPITG
jgi:hypothetical protein